MAVVYTAIKADDNKREVVKAKITELSGMNSVCFENRLELPLGCPSGLSFLIEMHSEDTCSIQKTIEEVKKIEGIRETIPLYQCEMFRK